MDNSRRCCYEASSDVLRFLLDFFCFWRSQKVSFFNNVQDISRKGLTIKGANEGTFLGFQTCCRGQAN